MALSMIEEQVSIEMADGRASGCLLRPNADRRLPGVIHLTDIGGIRPAQIQMARQLAEAGYVVLVPNLFYRTGGKPALQRPPEVSREVMLSQVDALVQSFTAGMITSDGGRYVDFLIRQSPVRGGGVGVVGYCFSGAWALRTAA